MGSSSPRNPLGPLQYRAPWGEATMRAQPPEPPPGWPYTGRRNPDAGLPSCVECALKPCFPLLSCPLSYQLHDYRWTCANSCSHEVAAASLDRERVTAFAGDMEPPRPVKSPPVHPPRVV